MAKVVDFSKSVYTLCSEDPRIKEIMFSLGFENITEGKNLQTVGRFMTIPRGARMKGIDLEKVKEAFRKQGYEIVE